MNGFKLVSSKQLIAELYQDFNISNDDWVNKAQRHITRGIELMGVDGYFERAYLVQDVVEYQAPLPCDSKNILAILTNVNGTVHRLPLTKSLALGMDFSGISDHSIYQGGINHDMLRTNFQEGKVLYIYNRIPKDTEGDLLIPDNAWLLEAIPFFVIYKMSLTGYKHPVVSYQMAKDEWRALYPRAKNNLNFPSVEEMHRYTKMVNNPVFTDIINEDWNTLGEGSVAATPIFDY